MSITIQDYNLVNLLISYVGEPSIAVDILNMSNEILDNYEEKINALANCTNKWVEESLNKTRNERIILIKLFINDMTKYKEILILSEFGELLNIIRVKIDEFSSFELFSTDHQFMMNLNFIQSWGK